MHLCSVATLQRRRCDKTTEENRSGSVNSLLWWANVKLKTMFDCQKRVYAAIQNCRPLGQQQNWSGLAAHRGLALEWSCTVGQDWLKTERNDNNDALISARNWQADGFAASRLLSMWQHGGRNVWGTPAFTDSVNFLHGNKQRKSSEVHFRVFERGKKRSSVPRRLLKLHWCEGLRLKNWLHVPWSSRFIY